MLEEWTTESNQLKATLHSKFQEKTVVHPELQGMNSPKPKTLTPKP